MWSAYDRRTSLRSSHLKTLTMSVMWVSRLMSLLMRCERSPTPVSVAVNTLWPCFSSRSDTRRQHQPPCQAPCTSTNVLRCAVCAMAGAPPSAAALAPALALASTARRVNEGSLLAVIISSREIYCCLDFSAAAPRRPDHRCCACARVDLDLTCVTSGQGRGGSRSCPPSGSAAGRRQDARRTQNAWANRLLRAVSDHPLWITGTSLPLSAAAPRRPILKGPANQQGRLYAVSAPIPRRTARAPSGLGGGGAARASQKGGPRMEGAVALQQGANALVLRQ